VHPVFLHIGPLVVPSYGAMAALGVLLALALALRTSRIADVDRNQIWNLCILSLFAALVGSRILLVLLNWTVIRSHPAWLFDVAMIHHPLLAASGALFALSAAVPYMRFLHLPVRKVADALAAPLCLGVASEQLGALLAGSGYGTETDVRWAIVYTHPLAARWSGAPLFTPVHPVQAYTALAFFLIAVTLYFWMPHLRHQGDVAGAGLLAAGAAVYFTEFWRDPEGRGSVFQKALDGPQVAAIMLVLVGAIALLRGQDAQIAANTAGGIHETPVEASHE
jgi:phosphatidylglycerol:prolipoprotein diacylglycerol transferase